MQRQWYITQSPKVTKQSHTRLLSFLYSCSCNEVVYSYRKKRTNIFHAKQCYVDYQWAQRYEHQLQCVPLVVSLHSICRGSTYRAVCSTWCFRSSRTANVCSTIHITTVHSSLPLAAQNADVAPLWSRATQCVLNFLRFAQPVFYLSLCCIYYANKS